MSLTNLKRCIAGVLALALCNFASLVSAEGYIGGSAGITSVDVCDDLSGLGVTSCDDEDTGFKIFGGYKFNPNFAVEGLWADLGEVSATGPGGSASMEVDGFGAAAVGVIPLNEKFSIFGKVGAFMWDASGGGGAAGSDDDGTDIMFGAGVGWNFTPKFGLRAEWERFDIDGDDVDFLSVGLQFNF
jgi:OOP family OmpA-OmpF porin